MHLKQIMQDFCGKVSKLCIKNNKKKLEKVFSNKSIFFEYFTIKCITSLASITISHNYTFNMNFDHRKELKLLLLPYLSSLPIAIAFITYIYSIYTQDPF